MNTRSTRRAFAVIAAFILISSATPQALAVTPLELVPVGQTVGIDIKCKGVMVVAIGGVESEHGTVTPGVDAGLLLGDVITQVGSHEITSAAQFKEVINGVAGETISVHVLRAGQKLQLNITPAADKSGKYELGLWLRDSMAGIGTVTFYDPKSGIFGALGHAVSEVETGALMPLADGCIMPASVKSIRRGTPGAPGELSGEFDFTQKIGILFANTMSGIFGHAADSAAFSHTDPLPIGTAGDLTLGAAKIRANVEGTHIQEFDIEISRIFSGGDDRNMMITVTDEALLALTGGIVQGMSGSPILQNGKLVGAVTHVLINNPERGYGICIEHMMEHAFTDAVLEGFAA